jgi:uncharacterized membrane protein
MKQFIAILAFLLFATAAKSSFAYFKVCNQRSVTAWVAQAHYQASATSFTGPCSSSKLVSCYESDWKVEGWWEIAPGACAVAIGGDLTNRYVYVHADYSDGSKVAGSTGLQVEPPAFSWDEDGTLHGSNCIESTTTPDPCNDAPYNAGFRQIDVGNATTFTLNLTN